jgi:hypothetical protein
LKTAVIEQITPTPRASHAAIRQEEIVGDEADRIPRLLAVRFFEPRMVPRQVLARRRKHAGVRGMVDPFVLDLLGQRRLAGVPLHEMLHEVEEHVLDVLDAPVIPVAGQHEAFEDRAARQLRHHRRRLDHLLHAEESLACFPVRVGLLVAETRDEPLDVHRELLERARLGVIVVEAERVEHHAPEPRIGDVVPEELDLGQLPGFVHLGQQAGEALDRIDRHRLPADQNVGRADRFSKASQRRRIVEVRGAEVLQRPLLSRLLAESGEG